MKKIFKILVVVGLVATIFLVSVIGVTAIEYNGSYKVGDIFQPYKMSLKDINAKDIPGTSTIGETSNTVYTNVVNTSSTVVDCFYIFSNFYFIPSENGFSNDDIISFDLTVNYRIVHDEYDIGYSDLFNPKNCHVEFYHTKNDLPTGSAFNITNVTESYTIKNKRQSKPNSVGEIVTTFDVVFSIYCDLRTYTHLNNGHYWWFRTIVYYPQSFLPNECRVSLVDTLNFSVSSIPPTHNNPTVEYGGMITDYGNTEKDLYSATGEGYDDSVDMFDDFGSNFNNFALSLMAIKGMVDYFLEDSPIYPILFISLTLGLGGFLLNIGSSKISKHRREKEERSNEENDKGGGQ